MQGSARLTPAHLTPPRPTGLRGQLHFPSQTSSSQAFRSAPSGSSPVTVASDRRVPASTGQSQHSSRVACWHHVTFSSTLFLLSAPGTPLPLGSLLASPARPQPPLWVPSFSKLGGPGPQASSRWSFSLTTLSPLMQLPVRMSALEFTQTKLLSPRILSTPPTESPSAASSVQTDLTQKPCCHL